MVLVDKCAPVVAEWDDLAAWLKGRLGRVVTYTSGRPDTDVIADGTLTSVEAIHEDDDHHHPQRGLRLELGSTVVLIDRRDVERVEGVQVGSQPGVAATAADGRWLSVVDEGRARG